MTHEIDGESYTIKEMMNELHKAATPYAAHYWFYHLTMALSPLEQSLIGLRIQIKNEMKMRGPLAHSVADIKGLTGGPPENLSPNKVFVGALGDYTINMHNLWQWINEALLLRLQYNYGWLALLLFAKHHQLLLKDDTKSFVEQMSLWFSNATHPCTSDSVNTYRKGFFRKKDFDYKAWLNLPSAIPADYKYEKDQHPEGFKHIQALCLALEDAYDLGQIATKNTNK